jgi:Zn-dependent peptidase ImmA (M78 family)
MLRDLIRHAGTLGARVHFAPIEDDPTLLGYFLPEQRRIVVKIGLVLGQSRWVLGHECGHAYYGHRCNGTRADDANERQADAYASRLLIDPVEYARLEAINPDPHWLADEFSVDVECIFAFERHWLTRLTGVTYTRAQMGAGRWAHRVATA